MNSRPGRPARTGQQASCKMAAAASPAAAAAAPGLRTKGVPFERGLAVSRELSLCVTEPITWTRDLVQGATEGYPHVICIAHCLWGCTSFRMQQDATGGTPTWLHSFVGSFFCNCFGSNAVVDVLLGTGIGIFPSKWMLPLYTASFMAVQYSPLDLVYRSIAAPASPVRLALTYMEALDCTAAVMGAMDKAQALHPSSPWAAFLAGMMAMCAGGLTRYFEQKGRGLDGVKTPWATGDTTVFRTGVVYSFLYCCGSGAWGHLPSEAMSKVG